MRRPTLVAQMLRRGGVRFVSSGSVRATSPRIGTRVAHIGGRPDQELAGGRPTACRTPGNQLGELRAVDGGAPGRPYHLDSQKSVTVTMPTTEVLHIAEVARWMGNMLRGPKG